VNQRITEVTQGKFQLADIAAPLWLPSRVKVYVEFTTTTETWTNISS